MTSTLRSFTQRFPRALPILGTSVAAAGITTAFNEIESPAYRRSRIEAGTTSFITTAVVLPLTEHLLKAPISIPLFIGFYSVGKLGMFLYHNTTLHARVTKGDQEIFVYPRPSAKREN